MMKVRSKLPLLKFDELAWYFNQTWCNYSEQITNIWKERGHALMHEYLFEKVCADTAENGPPKGGSKVVPSISDPRLPLEVSPSAGVSPHAQGVGLFARGPRTPPRCADFAVRKRSLLFDRRDANCVRFRSIARKRCCETGN